MVGKGYERLCVRGELETEQRLQYIDPPGPPVIAVRLFVLLSCSTGGLGTQPLCWELVPTARSGTLTSSSELELPDFLSHSGLYNCSTSTQFNPSTAKAIPWFPDIFDRLHLLFTRVHFFFWQLGRVGGQYATRLPQWMPWIWNKTTWW